jgi:glutamate--cysteine ligase
MNFEPVAFADACNNPCQSVDATSNRFYAYGVISRLALLAATMESN